MWTNTARAATSCRRSSISSAWSSTPACSWAILWEGQDFAAFRNYSFISDYGRYNASTGVFTPAEGAPEPPEGYVQDMVDEIMQMYAYSKTIVYDNYYGKVFG